MNLTEKEQSAVIRRVSSAITCIQDGNNATEVLSNIYRENLPDKSAFQGELMAKNLIKWMNAFREGYVTATEYPEEYLEAWLDEVLADLPEEKRKEEKAGFLKELVAQPNVLDSGEGITKECLRARNQVGEEMLMAATAMVLYTMAKNGELSGLPEDSTLAQITLCTCAEYRGAELAYSKEQCYITDEQADKQSEGLNSAFHGLMLGARAVSGASLAAGLASLLSVSAATLAWVGGVTYLVYKAFGVMTKNEEMPAKMNVLNNELSDEDIAAVIEKETKVNNVPQQTSEQQNRMQKKENENKRSQKATT